MFVSLFDALTRDDLPHKLRIKVSDDLPHKLGIKVSTIRPRLVLGPNV